MNGTEEVLAVYEYDIDGVETLREIFDTPVSNFDDEQIAKLRAGIIAKGESELEMMLENYAE